MKNDSGKTKAILIAVISILVVALVAVLVVFKIKGSKDDKKGSAGEQTATMTLIEKSSDEYVFIDTNGNIRKLSKKSIGELDSMNDGTIIYQNSLHAKKDKKEYIIDFSGNTLFESDRQIKPLVNNKEAAIYQYSKDGKYGLLNAKGEEIVEAKYSDYFNTLDQKLDTYIYTTGYSGNGGEKEVHFFDKDGKMIYSGPIEDTSLLGNKCGKTRAGVNLITFRESKTSVVVLNLNTGDKLTTLQDAGDHAFDIDIKGNVAVITSYKQGTYGANEGENVTKYVWFDENGKISKALNKTENEHLSFWNGSADEDYTIYTNENREEVAINKYGKEVYKSSKGLEQANYTNEVTGKTTSVIIDKLSGTVNSEGKVLFDKATKSIGNKYLFDGSTLYNLDGTKYMENVKSYKSVYNIELIKTADKTIIENQDGKSVEKEATFALEGDYKLLSDSTFAVIAKDKKVTLVNMNDLSFKELDTKDSKYVLAYKGFITVGGSDSGYTYYNTNGDKIYTKKK